MNQLDMIAREYLEAQRVIETALREWGMSCPKSRAQDIIARLAEHRPPILLDMQDEPQPGEPDSAGDRHG